MAMITECKALGVNRKRTCELLQIDERRVRDWFARKTLVDAKPGPTHAPHALLPEEREAIVALSKDEQYADDSHRVLTAKCVDAGIIAASASTVYSIMRAEGLTADRSGCSTRNGNSRKPDRPELTEPNQRWCWDISYLKTLVLGEFLFLYALLDEFSRKVVGFRISWKMNKEEGMELVEEGIEREGLTSEQVTTVTLFNDRGTQMKAKAFKKFLEDLGISQKFARPRTPNDNPFVESLFSTTKRDPNFPDSFVDDVDALTYFTAYFNFYNNERLHGRIGYVTHSQRHRGEDVAILANRNERIAGARIMRMSKNRESKKIVDVRESEKCSQQQSQLSECCA
jgi:transposase InsO family protein